MKAAYELLSTPEVCPDCEGTGKVRLKQGKYITVTVPCPNCWRSK